MLMILKHNKSFWLTAESIQEILDSDDFRDPEQEQEESDSEEEGEEGLYQYIAIYWYCIVWKVVSGIAILLCGRVATILLQYIVP